MTMNPQSLPVPARTASHGLYAQLLRLVGAHLPSSARQQAPPDTGEVVLPSPQTLLASGLYAALDVRPDDEQAAFVREDPVTLAHDLDLLGCHAGVQSALDRLRRGIECRDERARMIRRVQRRLVGNCDEDAAST